jgi:hypothetical protein
MPTSTTHPAYPRLLQLARAIAYEHAAAEAVSGDAFTETVHGMTVFYRRTIMTDGRKIEVNATTEQARPTFEWLAEITIDDKGTNYYQHFLLRPADLVETYGKTVLDVEPARATELADELERAANRN